MTAQAKQAADKIRQCYPHFTPEIALMSGSGLAELADLIEDPVCITYDKLPGFYSPQVEGHLSQLVLGKLSGVSVICLQGRPHLYEGIDASVTKTMVRTCRLLGCHSWLATNAAGSLNSAFDVGSLVVVNDHINLQFSNPLMGLNDDEFGPRFISMENTYDKMLRERLHRLAKQRNISLNEGVYIACIGPSFETPAEIKAFRLWGADLVGMSTIPEVIIARHCGLRVVCLSVVSNLAAGLHPVALSHEETLAGAAKGKADLLTLVQDFIRGDDR